MRFQSCGTLSLLQALPAGLVLFAACPFSASAQVVPPNRNETGVAAYAFDLSQVQLADGNRWRENQDRTLRYLKDVDVERLLYNFRANHGLSTGDAKANGGWDAPDFPFRTHMQGHFLTAWAQCWATLRDSECRDRAVYFAAELARCQANNGVAGFADGYLSGFPESEFDALEDRTLNNGNVPYYAIHKTLAGLLDVWRHIGDETAETTLLALAGWVYERTGKLSYDQMQKMMSTEFGGMNEVFADIYYWDGDEKWLETAQRFDQVSIFDPLAAGQDRLSGLHANTQVPKWIGAAREYKQTGTTRYRDIARNAWEITVNDHTYAIGGNSQAEHFKDPDAIAAHLTDDTCEACNTYNMLKLTRELWTLEPANSSHYFDFYEHALLNHLLGQQDPASHHGHVTYFTPLKAGGRRGVGPAWGGGTWSTDYDSFWCCQGTGVETNTKLMDSIYAYDDSSLYVNLFTPSTLDWSQRGVKVTQATDFPVSDETTLTITGDGGTWDLKVRIPSWAADGATVSVNGEEESSGEPGTYSTVSRTWKSGDTVTVRLPMRLRLIPANDDPNVAALAFGPVVLSGNYGDTTLTANPALDLGSVTQRAGGSGGLAFTATADGKAVDLDPFYNAHGHNYVVYWRTSGELPQDVA